MKFSLVVAFLVCLLVASCAQANVIERLRVVRSPGGGYGRGGGYGGGGHGGGYGGGGHGGGGGGSFSGSRSQASSSSWGGGGLSGSKSQASSGSFSRGGGGYHG